MLLAGQNWCYLGPVRTGSVALHLWQLLCWFIKNNHQISHKHGIVLLIDRFLNTWHFCKEPGYYLPSSHCASLWAFLQSHVISETKELQLTSLCNRSSAERYWNARKEISDIRRSRCPPCEGYQTSAGAGSFLACCFLGRRAPRLWLQPLLPTSSRTYSPLGVAGRIGTCLCNRFYSILLLSALPEYCKPSGDLLRHLLMLHL